MPDASTSPTPVTRAWWQDLLDLKTLITLISFAMSAVAFYRTNLYTKDDLELTVNDISYSTNAAALYMTMTLANRGNRDAQIIRVRPLLWARRGNQSAWRPLTDPVDASVARDKPEPPFTVKAAGFEGVHLSVGLDPTEAEGHAEPGDPSTQAVYLGVELASVDGNGSTHMVQAPVVKLGLDSQTRIRFAEPAIHRTLNVLQDLAGVPPGDQLGANKQTPFVWADEHFH